MNVGLAKKDELFKVDWYKEISDFDKRFKPWYKDHMLLKIDDKVYNDIVKSIGVEVEQRKDKIKSLSDEISLLEKQDVWFNWFDDFENYVDEIKKWNREMDDFDEDERIPHKDN